MKPSYLKHVLGIATLACVLLATPPAAQADRRRAVALNNTAIELDKQGKTAEALPLLDEALTLDPGSITILKNRCLVLRDLGRYDTAMADVQDLLRRQPHNPEFLLIRGTLHFRKRDRDKAIQDFNAAIDQDSDNPEFVKVYNSYVSVLDPASYHYITLRRLGRENWTWDNDAKYQNLVFPITYLGTALNANAAKQALTPAASEIRFHGRITGRDTAKGTLQVEVVAFGTANGGFKALPAPKLKTLHAGKATIELGDLGTFPLTTLQNGDFVVLLGQDKPDGFIPRRSFTLMDPRPASSIKAWFNAKQFGELPVGTEAPNADLKAVGTPTIWPKSAHDEEAEGNLGFLVKDESSPVFFTTHPGIDHPIHQLEPAAFQEKRIRASLEKLPAELNWSQDSRLAITGRHSGTGNFIDRHIVALRVQEAPNALEFAKQLPKRGDKVWVSGHEGSSPTQCVVLHGDEKRLVLLSADPKNEARQSGHPILNQAGEVVGMVLSVEEDITVAAPVTALRRLAQPAPK